MVKKNYFFILMFLFFYELSAVECTFDLFGVVRAGSTGDLACFLEFYRDKLDDFNSILNSINENGCSLLHVACLNGYADVVLLLINAGANIEINDEDYSTPLHDACLNGYAYIVEFLITAGANVDIKDGSNYTPLHYVKIGLMGLLNKDRKKNYESIINQIIIAKDNYANYQKLRILPTSINERLACLNRKSYECYDKGNCFKNHKSKKAYRNYYYNDVSVSVCLFAKRNAKIGMLIEKEIQQQYMLAKMIQENQHLDVNFRFR